MKLCSHEENEYKLDLFFQEHTSQEQPTSAVLVPSHPSIKPRGMDFEVMEDAAVNYLSLQASENTFQIIDEAAREATENNTDLGMDATCQTLFVHCESKEVQTNFPSAVAPPVSQSQCSCQSLDDNQFCYENIAKDSDMFHFYTGLTLPQFQHLYCFISPDANHLNYWHGCKTKTERHFESRVRLSQKDQLVLTLTKLHQAVPNKDLAYRFQLSESTVSKIINTRIQFLFVKSAVLKKRMFPSYELVKQNLPSCFKSFKNVRVIIDCFEIFVQ